ncbi:uncharacterized protein LOC120070093 [Benincasa hispida]|uniref:uncharacterized protein LOC120070093 n=1 Tax=Benincasa hispida TaxID=102211 RepID=UPI0019014E67|nr:uncharacterized protein LOC120070093 [Benincasa hispida]
MGELKNRPQGRLPSSIELPRNPGITGKEHCQAVTLRSGKVMAEVRKDSSKTNSKEKPTIESKKPLSQTESKEPKTMELEDAITSKPPDHGTMKVQLPLFPQRLKRSKTMKVRQLTPTTVTLQLADRSLVHPEGKLKDVLVTKDKFILPVDIIILDYEADKDMPITLGRPFLSTSLAQIDVHKGEITMSINGKKLRFNIIKVMKFPEDEGLNKLSLKIENPRKKIKKERM